MGTFDELADKAKDTVAKIKDKFDGDSSGDAVKDIKRSAEDVASEVGRAAEDLKTEAGRKIEDIKDNLTN